MATENPPEKAERKNDRAAAEPSAKSNDAPHAATLEILRLTHQDVPEVVQLVRRVWEPYVGGFPPEVQKEWHPTPLEFTSGMEGITYFCAKREHKIIGVIGCEIRTGSCHLRHLGVDGEHRRGGIATALLAAATGWAQHANAKSMYVDLLARFPEALALLRSSGFTECGVLHRHFYGEDVRMFEKLL